jgi:hypothetical protein
VDVGHGINISTNEAQGQSLGKSRTESQRPIYVGLSRESGGEARGRNTTEVSGGTGVVACRIHAHRTPQRTPLILP